jgi:cell division protease FtsH
MDGFHSEANVVVVAATNRPDVLDPALLRPGRFDRQIIMDQPDRPGRKAILEVHARSKPLAESVDLNAIAGGTVGFVGADLENLLNEAALFAARRKSQEIEQKDIDDALLRVVAGPEKRARILPPHERKITAYHELGHAIVGHILEHCDPIERISIVSRGSALGFTLSLPQEEKFLISRNRLRDEMAMSLGGRAAEEIIFEDITTGASGDLERVTSVARQMIMRYAMGDKLGQRIFGHNHAQPFLGREFQSEPDYSDATAGQIDSEIKILVDEAYQRALALVTKNRGLLDSMAEILLERETLTRPEFEALFKGEKFVHVESPILTEEALSKETIQPIIASPLVESLKDIAAGRRAVVVMSDGRVLSANGVQLGLLENPDSLWSLDFAELDINVVNEHEVVVRLRISAKSAETE